MGQAGSGKTTQAQLLAKFLGVPLLDAGDLLRSIAQEQTPKGQAIKEIMGKGELIDDDMVIQSIEERLKSEEYAKGVVINGFPRTLGQAERFSVPTDKVFNIKISDDISAKRLLARGREDDTAEVIKNRLKVYHQEPIIAFYKDLGILEEVDGERSVEEIAQDIARRLEK